MTDAAVPITQSAVEQFTRRYFESFDSSIDVNGDQWLVTVPDGANTPFAGEELNLNCSATDAEVDENGEPLNPESSFFQQLVEDVSTESPLGWISVTVDTEGIQLPQWIAEDRIEVAEKAFTPYYDRTAVALLFRISIETVSEYQTELLRAITIDTQSSKPLPGLTDTYLNSTNVDRNRLADTSIEKTPEKVRDVLDEARNEVRDAIQPEIDEVHENASRAADRELEEYRQLQQQRIEELEEEIASLTTRIDELERTVQETTERDERAASLRERKELRAQQQDLEDEVADIRHRRESGFPKKQLEIRDRHALKVRITPVAATVIQYERGELDLTLSAGSVERSLRIGYGGGIGATETVSCDRCKATLSERNPLHSISTGIVCYECAVSEPPES
ncbi:hypothetical protein [Haloterrigena alkaliphila]|uniref:Uncharacterized protein n=1 Tax=Haloterrigena alkaliphila TaxID=2816475 RepID=A0A8A2VFU3_9EURY|nr:hypothetical protein [Haloterrigena alkaliphila]QSX00994.1 hypothetical protein J0X25_08580 [Haloterrigena alkaliphila]